MVGFISSVIVTLNVYCSHTLNAFICACLLVAARVNRQSKNVDRDKRTRQTHGSKLNEKSMQ